MFVKMKISLVGGATTVECQLKCQLELRGQAEQSSLSTNVDVQSKNFVQRLYVVVLGCLRLFRHTDINKQNMLMIDMMI